MSGPSHHLEYRRLRAPEADRSALVDPPFPDLPALVEANLRARGQYRVDLGGVRLEDVSRSARAELVGEAIRWTRSYRDVDVPDALPERLLFLAGHQPQLFHPGVWFKNFALGAVARQHGAIAVNLIIDSDTIKTASLRVPGGSEAQPNVVLLPLDEAGPVIPFEERRILDRSLFAGFGSRAMGQIAPLVADPLLGDYWPLAVALAVRGGNLGACLAQSRHQLEGRLGLSTLEVPQSRVCGLPSFARFASYLLAELPRLVEVYNDSVRQYRRVHGIRSTAHPVPDLAVEGPWREAPFWIWHRDDPRRRRLFVRHDRGRLVLADRRELRIELPLAADGNLDAAAAKLVELAAGPVKLRSRALITTLVARLVLGDLFFHGIGGAKYDQLTDALIARFFGLAPPGFVVLSATLQLPIQHPRPAAGDLAAIDSRLRQLSFHPEAFAGQGPCLGRCDELAHLVAAKRGWIETPPTPENARARLQEFRRINAALQPWVAAQRGGLLKRRAEVSAALRADAVLGWREYGFCLYPEPTLREFLASLLPE